MSLESEAVKLIKGDRGLTYGTPQEGLGRIARLWSAYLERELTVGDVARLMVLLKLARAQGGYSHDSYVDLVAYAVIAEESDGRPH
jgi:hypothetical protein